MIRIRRDRTNQSLDPGFTGPGLRKKLASLVRARLESSDRIKWEGVLGDWKKTKPRLRLESHGKCAYCEAPTAVVAHGDVEHFRPKSKYWWLALCVDNYVFACQLCNQTHKGDWFEVSGKRMRGPRLPRALPASATALEELFQGICPDPATVDEEALRAEWSAEQPHLPHPYLEDPEPLFVWQVIETKEAVEVTAPDDATLQSKRAVAAVVEHLGLNRETLTKERYLIYAALFDAILLWKSVNPGRI
ncbi:MAG: hypothetical protein FJX57_21670, partial [Alphaproteobacteria bacterium]|nr:hypothetical protein [Alphaproteobacteria bacterium]